MNALFQYEGMPNDGKPQLYKIVKIQNPFFILRLPALHFYNKKTLKRHQRNLLSTHFLKLFFTLRR